MLENPKLYTLAELLPVLAPLRRGGQKLVFTNGCYDLLHPGHVDFLARCKRLGDKLILGLNSDASVSRQGKTPARPVVPFNERAFVLAHLEAIDFIVGFEDDTPAGLIAELRPQVLVKGGDWPVEKIAGRESVLAGGGEVLSLPLVPGYSTTGLIKKIKSL